jgi:hypothetical protein
VILSLLYLLLLRVLGVFQSDERAAAEAELENAVLRHQIAILPPTGEAADLPDPGQSVPGRCQQAATARGTGLVPRTP